MTGLRVGGEHSRKKEPIEQLVNSYSEHLHMSSRHGSLPVHVLHEHT
jgi:hypothetical protein